jgi:hypothetical protein
LSPGGNYETQRENASNSGIMHQIPQPGELEMRPLCSWMPSFANQTACMTHISVGTHAARESANSCLGLSLWRRSEVLQNPVLSSVQKGQAAAGVPRGVADDELRCLISSLVEDGPRRAPWIIMRTPSEVRVSKFAKGSSGGYSGQPRVRGLLPRINSFCQYSTEMPRNKDKGLIDAF